MGCRIGVDDQTQMVGHHRAGVHTERKAAGERVVDALFDQRIDSALA